MFPLLDLIILGVKAAFAPSLGGTWVQMIVIN